MFLSNFFSKCRSRRNNEMSERKLANEPITRSFRHEVRRPLLTEDYFQNANSNNHNNHLTHIDIKTTNPDLKNSTHEEIYYDASQVMYTMSELKSAEKELVIIINEIKKRSARRVKLGTLVTLAPALGILTSIIHLIYSERTYVNVTNHYLLQSNN